MTNFAHSVCEIIPQHSADSVCGIGEDRIHPHFRASSHSDLPPFVVPLCPALGCEERARTSLLRGGILAGRVIRPSVGPPNRHALLREDCAIQEQGCHADEGDEDAVRGSSRIYPSCPQTAHNNKHQDIRSNYQVGDRRPGIPCLERNQVRVILFEFVAIGIAGAGKQRHCSRSGICRIAIEREWHLASSISC